MKLLWSLVNRFWWILAIFALVATIAFTNHIPNTTLSGWDTLHPEFDLAGYTSRVINGVWQQHQGLGGPPSQAHAAELVRLPVLWVMSLIMPLNLIRYVFLFLMIYIGCVGVALFVNSLSISKLKSNLPGFIAAVFYLLSLVSVQQFYVPLEMFAVHFAVVPWLMFCLHNLMLDSERKWIWWFLVLSIIGAPQAHTATLYYVLIALMGIFVVIMSIGTWSTQKFKRGVTAIILGIVVNLYWIGPNIFYLMTRGQQVAQSKIHYEFTPEAVLQNQAYGDIKDIAIGRNFLFNWFDYSFEQQKFIPLLDLWHRNFGSKSVSIIMYSFAVIAVIGLLCLAIKKSAYRSLGWSSLVLLGTTVFFLINENPPTGFIFNFLIEKFPIIGEGLRFPFTKFSIFYLFLMAIGFGISFKYLFSLIKWKFLRFGLVLGLLFCFGFAYKPVFMGGYVSHNMQVEIPKEYFKLFEFMRTQDSNARVVLMPIPNYWGWTYNDWTKYGYKNGYQGAGFLWFGLRQPLLNREFDRWSIYNEDFYHNFSNTIYQGKSGDIGNVLRKYDVRYVLLDESVIAPGQDKEILRIEETKKLAEELGWKKVFNENFLSVWEIPIGSDPVSRLLARLNISADGRDLLSGSDPGEQGAGLQGISAPKSYTWVEGETSKVRKDAIYDQVGTYVQNSSEDAPFAGWRALLGLQPRIPFKERPLAAEDVITYPFAGLMKEEVKKLEYENGVTTVRSDLVGFENYLHPTRSDLGSQERELVIPGWKVGEIVRVEFDEKGEPLPVYRVNTTSPTATLGAQWADGAIFLGKEKPEEGKNIIYARISSGDEWSEYLSERKFDLRGETLKVEVPGEPQIYDFGKEGVGTVGNCDVLSRGNAAKHAANDLQQTVYEADGRGAACDYVVMGELDTRLSYLMRVQGENKEGRSLKFFLYNTGSKRNDIEWLMSGRKSQTLGSDLPAFDSAGWALPLRSDPRGRTQGSFDQTFSMLPWSWDGYYTLNIETRSFGQRAENRIDPVEVRWFPLEQIVGARIVPIRSDLPASTIAGWDQPLRSDLVITEVKKTGTWLYRVKVEGSGLLKLSQGYDEGWIAPPIEHVKVDGWANGWIINGSGEVIILYWPQLLEYLGFEILGVTLAWIWKSKF